MGVAGFVACNKEDGVAFRVEGESDAPLTIGRTEAELFHIGVTGIVQRIDARTPQPIMSLNTYGAKVISPPVGYVVENLRLIRQVIGAGS